MVLDKIATFSLHVRKIKILMMMIISMTTITTIIVIIIMVRYFSSDYLSPLSFFYNSRNFFSIFKRCNSVSFL